MVLAGIVAVSITTLRGRADRARQVQLIVAEIDGDAQHISRIEAQSEIAPGLTPALDAEFELVQRRMDGLIEDYARRTGRADARQLSAQTHRYMQAVSREFVLRRDGWVAISKEFGHRVVDPRFESLQRQLEVVGKTQGESAKAASAATDLGIGISLLLGALAFVAMLVRLDSIRGAAARELHQDLEVQALSDALTGLPNRRQLMLDLDHASLRAGAGTRCLLVLCDLDGFKAYNDTFGHLEGDLLLGRLSAKLARTAAPHGTAYRLGGDEFCALLYVDQDEREPTLAECHAALSESGSGFDIRASIGSVVLPDEASDSSTALRLADERMYAQKNERGASVTHQLRAVILRVLALQDPDLYGHVQDVARLAAGVGRRLDLDDAQITNLVRAAELHDVGKIAIPDSILHKPGPLDPDEQEFIQRHTLIGENILSAAPVLAGIGRLVRSSHERYDGTGYPDGLREDEIPLPSRIIFVCDSFDAMTTDRPYRKAMTDTEALAELKHCAFTQFDPAVVDAFATELAALRTTGRTAGDERHGPNPPGLHRSGKPSDVPPQPARSNRPASRAEPPRV